MSVSLMKNSTRERLECLAEEMAEATQMVMKSLRHGLDSTHRDYGGHLNDALLAKEIGHVMAWLDLLVGQNEIPQWAIDEARKEKLRKIRRGTHFHHQHDVAAGIAADL